MIEADAKSIGGGRPVIIRATGCSTTKTSSTRSIVPVLHGWFSGAQFVKEMGSMPRRNSNHQLRRAGGLAPAFEDGRRFKRISGVALPTLRVVPNPRLGRFERVESIGWVLPIDDTHFRIYTVGRVREKGELGGFRSRQGGKLWWELTEEEHRRFRRLRGDDGPGVDHRALGGALATSDTGIALLRRFLLTRQLEIVAGRRPDGHGVRPGGLTS